MVRSTRSLLPSVRTPVGRLVCTVGDQQRCVTLVVNFIKTCKHQDILTWCMLELLLMEWIVFQCRCVMGTSEGKELVHSPRFMQQRQWGVFVSFVCYGFMFLLWFLYVPCFGSNVNVRFFMLYLPQFDVVDYLCESNKPPVRKELPCLVLGRWEWQSNSSWSQPAWNPSSTTVHSMQKTSMPRVYRWSTTPPCSCLGSARKEPAKRTVSTRLRLAVQQEAAW